MGKTSIVKIYIIQISNNKTIDIVTNTLRTLIISHNVAVKTDEEVIISRWTYEQYKE